MGSSSPIPPPPEGKPPPHRANTIRKPSVLFTLFRQFASRRFYRFLPDDTGDESETRASDDNGVSLLRKPFGTLKEKGATSDDLFSSRFPLLQRSLRIGAHTHARAWIQHNFLLRPSHCPTIYFSLSPSSSSALSRPANSTLLSRAFRTRGMNVTHTRVALLAATSRYKEATLRRASTVPRSSPRRAQKRDLRYSGARPIATATYVLCTHALSSIHPSVRSSPCAPVARRVTIIVVAASSSAVREHFATPSDAMT